MALREMVRVSARRSEYIYGCFAMQAMLLGIEGLKVLEEGRVKRTMRSITYVHVPQAAPALCDVALVRISFRGGAIELGFTLYQIRFA